MSRKHISRKPIYRRALTWGLISSFSSGFLFVLLFFPKIEASSLTQKTFEKKLVEPLVDSPGKTIGSDFNGDGIHDIMTSSILNDDPPGDNGGAVYILYGTSSFSSTYRLDGAGVNVTVLAKAASDRLGVRTASAGDLNSDGFDDIVMGANLNDDGAVSDSGAAYILYGHPSLASDIRLDGSGVDVTIIGKTASEHFGYDVASGGDINGDGFDDLLVTGRYSDDGPGTNSGSVFILYGSASLSADYDIAGTGVNVTITGKAASDSLSRVSSAGDVNSDGFDDVLMGALFNDDGADPNGGTLYVLFGGSSLASDTRAAAATNITLLGKAANDYLGVKVSGLGDINGDGFADFGGGALGNDDGPGANNNGAGYIIYGRTFPANLTLDTASTEENVRLLGNADTDTLGEDGFAAAGDVNDDGLADIFAASRLNDAQANNAGTAYIIYGSTSLASSITMGNNDVTITGKTASDQFGFSI